MADPFGHSDAGGIPASGIHRPVQQEARWLSAYSQGVLLQDVTLVDRNAPPVITGFIGEDGEEMTYERRCEIAKSRQMADPKDFRTATFGDALGKREPYGKTPVELRRKDIVIVTAREADPTCADTADEMAELDRALEIEKQANAVTEE